VLNNLAHWRITFGSTERSPWAADDAGRHLRIVIDDETLEESKALHLLTNLVSKPTVDVFHTAASAPHRVEFGAGRGEGNFVARYVTPTETRELGLSNSKSWDDHAETESAETGIDAGEARRGLRLGQTASRHDVDILVTGTPVLTSPRFKTFASDANVQTSEQACATAGLYLRAHGDFSISSDPQGSQFVPVEFFYAWAASAGMPEYNAWLGHCFRNPDSPLGGAKGVRMTGSLGVRLGRALQGREYVEVRSRHQYPEDSWGEVMYFFENSLLSVVGAFDVLARMLHLLAEMPKQMRTAGFQKTDWVSALLDKTDDSGLQTALGDGTLTSTVQAIGVLRNFVHEEVLSQNMTFIDPDTGDRELVDYGPRRLSIPAPQSETLAGHLTDPDSWGFQAQADGTATIEPELFLNHALDLGRRQIRSVLDTDIIDPGTPLDGVEIEHMTPWARYAEDLRLLTGLPADSHDRSTAAKYARPMDGVHQTQDLETGLLDYVAIDFETANAYRGSPCALGLVRVRDGSPVDEQRWLIRPPAQVDYFDAFNIHLHGITPEMVQHAPRWSQVLPMLLDYIGDDVVVAHNAGFDIGVIRYACAVDGIPWPEMRFLCTLVLARRALRLGSYRLPWVADALGVEFTNHHDPLADTLAVVAVVRGLAERQGVSDLDRLAASLNVVIGRMSAGSYAGSVRLGGGLLQPTVNTAADPDGHLYGRVVVITGTLFSMTRQIAWEEAARVGAMPEKNTTKRTNVLVVGDINPASLRPGSELTGKTRRAFELQADGQDIEVMAEDDFLQCLDGKPFADVIPAPA